MRRRQEPRPPERDDLGQQMLIGHLGYCPGMVGDEPVLLMRYEGNVSGEKEPQVVTIAVPAAGVDKFLTATQQGVAMYKSVLAGEDQ